MKYGMLKVPYRNKITSKKCYEAWFSEGSLERARDKLEADGVVSSRGKPYSKDGVCKAAKSYMVNNYEDSKKMLLETCEKNGYLVEERYIEQYLIQMAVGYFRTPERVKYWLVKNGLFGKHVKFLESLIAIHYD